MSHSQHNRGHRVHKKTISLAFIAIGAIGICTFGGEVGGNGSAETELAGVKIGRWSIVNAGSLFNRDVSRIGGELPNKTGDAS